MIVKELFMEAHDELAWEYMEQHPEADEQEAYDKTADAAHRRMTDKYAEMIDHQRQIRKDGMQ